VTPIFITLVAIITYLIYKADKIPSDLEGHTPDHDITGRLICTVFVAIPAAAAIMFAGMLIIGGLAAL
jgi:hypothetical protein